jgi:hypothetical protein
VRQQGNTYPFDDFGGDIEATLVDASARDFGAQGVTRHDTALVLGLLVDLVLEHLHEISHAVQAARRATHVPARVVAVVDKFLAVLLKGLRLLELDEDGAGGGSGRGANRSVDALSGSLRVVLVIVTAEGLQGC